MPDSVCGQDREENDSNTQVSVGLQLVVEEMTKIAGAKKRDDVLPSFCMKYLHCFILEKQKSNASAEQMFDRLKVAVDARENIHQLEREMDKQHFVDLVTGGFHMYGGVDKKTQLPIFWYRSGLIDRECWRYSRGCPRAKSYVRARILHIESHNAQLMELSPNCSGAVYVDESDRKALDFNVGLMSMYFRILDAIVPLPFARCIIFGAGRFPNVLFSAMKRFSPKLFDGVALDMLEHGDAEYEVEDTKEIPEFWYQDGQGKPYLSTDRRNVWCYERCLSEENRITLKDVYNPVPWPYEEIDYDTVRAEVAELADDSALPAIEEDDEEEEEW